VEQGSNKVISHKPKPRIRPARGELSRQARKWTFKLSIGLKPSF